VNNSSEFENKPQKMALRQKSNLGFFFFTRPGCTLPLGLKFKLKIAICVDFYNCCPERSGCMLNRGALAAHETSQYLYLNEKSIKKHIGGSTAL
jgi:hypothetical protein